MPIDLHDTIAAPASPPGAAPRGIIRISGDTVVHVVDRLFHASDNTVDWRNGRRAIRIDGHLNIPRVNVPLPVALMLWPTVRSYTGQPMAELHMAGSAPLLDAVLERLTECGARMANRGEFTMRAFLAGRIDLIQAEAVLGVIDAADHEELEKALGQLGGGVTSKLATVRGQLLSLLGDLEAGLDFVEEDIEFVSSAEMTRRLKECQRIVAELTESSGNRLPSGYRPRIVLAGLPNAGKSTLFNRLAGSGKAIVSAVAGTTRDYLTSTVRLGRVDVEIVDTAGWESASDLIMKQAQEQRSEQMRRCDLVVWCSAIDLSRDELAQNDQLLQRVTSRGVPILKVQTRADLAGDSTASADVVLISAVSGDGIPQLAVAIEEALSRAATGRSELVAASATRCRDALRLVSSSLEAAVSAAQEQLGDEIVALELRASLHQIGVILGDVYTDDILDHIFSNFCIGK